MFRSILRRRPSATGIVAVIALVFAMGGSAVAAKLITGKQIKNSSVTGVDIKNGSLGAGELSKKARASLVGKAGPAGAAGTPGAPGTPGAKGDKGDRGPSTADAAHVEGGHGITANPASHEVLGGAVPPGKYVIQAKFVLRNTTAEDGEPNCELFVLRGDMPETIDQVDGVAVQPSGTEGDTVEYTLMGFADLDNTPENGYGVRCAPDGVQFLNVRDRTLIATQVGDITG